MTHELQRRVPEIYPSKSVDMGRLALFRGSLHLEARCAQVFAWGSNTHGELGIGSSSRVSAIPVLLEALRSERVEHLAAGACHAACVTAKGELFTWGDGSSAEASESGLCCPQQ